MASTTQTTSVTLDEAASLWLDETYDRLGGRDGKMRLEVCTAGAAAGGVASAGPVGPASMADGIWGHLRWSDIHSIHLHRGKDGLWTVTDATVLAPSVANPSRSNDYLREHLDRVASDLRIALARTRLASLLAWTVLGGEATADTLAEVASLRRYLIRECGISDSDHYEDVVRSMVRCDVR